MKNKAFFVVKSYKFIQIIRWVQRVPESFARGTRFELGYIRVWLHSTLFLSMQVWFAL